MTIIYGLRHIIRLARNRMVPTDTILAYCKAGSRRSDMSKSIINFVRNANFLALPLCCCFMLAPLQGMAEDIDIFSGPLGLAGAPNVMILVDNSQTGDGIYARKFNAISIVLDSITPAAPMSVGLAMWTPSATAPKGAYIRFAPKDMSVPAN